jgi:MFS family permease
MPEPTPSPPADSPSGGWLPLATTLGIQALASMALLTLPVMAPVVGPAVGVPATHAGLYVALVYVAAMIASLGAGSVVARFGALRVSQAGLVLCALGLLLCAVPSVWCMALGALTIGIGYGPVTPASSHLLSRSTPAHRMALVFSIKQTGVPVGGALAGAAVPGLLMVVGWQGALVIVAACSLLCALLAQPLRTPLDADRDPTRPFHLGSFAQPMRLVLSHPSLRMLAASSFVFSIAQMTLTTYLVTYLNTSLSYSLVAAGLALAVAQFGGIVGRVLWGWVADRWVGARAMLALLAGGMAVSALATALVQPSWPQSLVLAVLLVFGASAVGWNGVYLAEVARRAPPGFAGIATGGTLAFTFFGVVLGPSLIGALSAAMGSLRAGFVTVFVLTAACACVLARRSG